MGYKETYKEDWNKKNMACYSQGHFAKKSVGRERPTVMVKQYR